MLVELAGCVAESQVEGLLLRCTELGHEGGEIHVAEVRD